MKSKPAEKKIQVVAAIEASLHEKLEAIAVREERSVRDVLRRMVRIGVKVDDLKVEKGIDVFVGVPSS